jgi:peptide deformylase
MHSSIQILDLLEWPHPLLCEPSKPIDCFDKILESLIDQMWATLHHTGGVGLAAPQVGITQCLFIMDCRIAQPDAQSQVYINPTLFNPQGSTSFSEGCLSFPGLKIDVPRFETIDIRAQNTQGQWFTRSLEGLEAICAQHEYDHIEGKAFIDRLDPEHRKETLVQYHHFLQTRSQEFNPHNPHIPSIDTLSRVEQLLHQLHHSF